VHFDAVVGNGTHELPIDEYGTAKLPQDHLLE
jgi:hypothetical protein